MTPEQRQGRTILLFVIALMLLLDIGISAWFNYELGTEKLPRQIVRFLLTVLLCERIYSGSVIAKWIAVVLFGLTIVLMLISDRPADLRGVFIVGAMEAIYLAFLWALLFSESVKQYFQYRQNLRTNR